MLRNITAKYPVTQIIVQCFQTNVQCFQTFLKPLHIYLVSFPFMLNFATIPRDARAGGSGWRGAVTVIRMTKAELEKKKDLARALYFSGLEQTEIADKVGVSRVTVSKWCAADGWKEARAAKSITRPELIKKLLLATSTLLDKVNASGDLALVDSLGDKLSKLTAAIDKLDKSQANVVAAIEVFMAFSRWLEFRAKTDPEITPGLIKTLNRLQDGFLLESMSRGALA